MIERLLVLSLVAIPLSVRAQEAARYEGPIIDMHQHAYTADTYWGPAFEPYWSVAEEHGIPVGIHTGESFPGTPYEPCCPDFRVRLGNPLLLEDMLVAHPDLRVMAMHAGGFFWRRTLQLMQMYPQVYADLGVLAHAPGLARAGVLEAFVREAEQRGMLDRVMFGSDQMVWPEAIGISVEAVQALDFLTVEEKAAVFYDNAARFLGLDEETIARHHGR